MDPAFHDPEILLAHDGFVRALSRSLIGDAFAADDLAQEAWVATLERPPRVRTSARAWLAGVVRNLVRERRRSEGRATAREEAAARPERVPSETEILEREEARRAVVVSVLALDEPYRTVLLLRYFEDATPREIARRLEVPFETARTRLKRAIELVRADLDRRQHGDRRAWCLALLPIARLAPSPASPSLLSEIASMSPSLQISIATVVLASLAAGVAGWLRGAPGPPASAPPVASRAADDPPAKGAASRRSDDAPRMVFDRLQHDFGEVREGLEVPTHFEFRNEGTAALKILDVRPSCGCTLGEITVDGRPYVFGDPIAPGATGAVKLVLRTANFAGSKDTHLDVLTNDLSASTTPDAPAGHYRLKAHAFIERLFEWGNNVSTMSLGAIPNTAATERTLTLRSTRNERFQIVGFQPAPTDVQLAAEPADDSGTQWTVKLTVPAGLALGSFTKQFAVETKPEAPNLSFTVMGVIRGAVDVTPPNGVLFGVIPKGQAVSKSVVISSTHPSAPLQLANIRLVDPKDHSIRSGSPGAPIDAAIGQHLELQHAVNDPGKADSITIVVKDTMPSGAFTALLVFETGVPDGPARVIVPIHGFVR